MVLGEPLQERARLGQLLARHRRWLLVEFPDHRAQLRDHRLPVLHGSANVTEHALDALNQPGARNRIGETVDLQMHDRFARPVGPILAVRQFLQVAVYVAPYCEDRMNDQVQGQPLPIDFDRRRIDQERHVVIDHLDDRVARAEPDVFLGRVEHSELRVARGRAGARTADATAACRTSLRRCARRRLPGPPAGSSLGRTSSTTPAPAADCARRSGRERPQAAEPCLARGWTRSVKCPSSCVSVFCPVAS